MKAKKKKKKNVQCGCVLVCVSSSFQFIISNEARALTTRTRVCGHIQQLHQLADAVGEKRHPIGRELFRSCGGNSMAAV